MHNYHEPVPSNQPANGYHTWGLLQSTTKCIGRSLGVHHGDLEKFSWSSESNWTAKDGKNTATYLELFGSWYNEDLLNVSQIDSI